MARAAVRRLAGAAAAGRPPLGEDRLVELVARIGEAASLDPIVAAVDRALRPVLDRRRITDVLSGYLVGHPLHPVLTDLPIGCWTSALVLDVTPGGARSARRLVGLGIVLAVPTMAAGWSDWLSTAGAERRVGLVHAVGNGVGLACFIRSWLRRKDGGGGRTWALLGVAAASGAGWLGGHLAFSMGVGVDTNAFQTGPAEWTATTRSGEPGRISAHQVDGVRVAVFEMGEGEHALADRCSHRGGPLSEGTLEQSCVVCPWHGSRFDVRTGRVRGGPATADQPGYEVRTVGEVTEVRRSESRALRRNPV